MALAVRGLDLSSDRRYSGAFVVVDQDCYSGAVRFLSIFVLCKEKCVAVCTSEEQIRRMRLTFEFSLKKIYPNFLSACQVSGLSRKNFSFEPQHH